MRIISGKYKGKQIIAPTNLPVRPTTDFAKTALFNILNNKIDFEKVALLDLFSGTGNISYEFVSRGCKNILAVDADAKCVRFINHTFELLEAINCEAIQSDAFRFLQSCFDKFDIIFADPPYDLKNPERIIELVFKKELLNKNGLLIVEHDSSKTNFSSLSNFVETRKYGHVGLSFFQSLE